MVKILFITILSLFLLTGNLNALQLTGNIAKSVEIQREGTLKELIEPVSNAVKYALLIGSDGTAALITSRSFSIVRLIKTEAGWNSTTNKLPAVCNIRNLKEICIYSRQFKENNFSDRIDDFEFIGQSSKNGYYARKYKELSGK